MYEDGNRRVSFNWLTLLIKLIILVIVVFLACWIFVRVLNNKNATEKKGVTTSAEYVNNMAAMKNAAMDYFTASKLPEKIGESEKISLAQMINQKMIIDFTNNGETCDINTSYAQATKTADGNYALKVSLDCEDKKDFIVTTIEKNNVVNTNNEVQCTNCNSNISNNTSANTNKTNTSTKTSSSTQKTNTSTKANTTTNTTKTNTSNSNSTNKTSQTIVIKTVYDYRISCSDCKTDVVVTFDSNGGSYVAKQVVGYNNFASKPANPTRAGYTFVEWQLNGKTYDFATRVTEDITLVAIWKAVPKNNYVVTFVSNGGTNVPSQTVVEGGKATKPANPTRAGYTFVEWQLNGQTYDFNTKVTSNITLVAIWKQALTRYYKLVKYSDWQDGYSNLANAENKKVTVTTLDYCKDTTQTYYSVGWVHTNSPAKSYSYEMQLLDIDPDDVNQATVAVVNSSKNYFSKTSLKDYNAYKAEKERFAVYMTGNTGKLDSELPVGALFNETSLGKNNFTFTTSGAYLKSGVYRVTININYKNGYGVTPFTSANPNISGQIYFVPLKFDVTYALKKDCVRDTEANSSKYPGRSISNPDYTDIWQHRTYQYMWSSNKNMTGWTWTGEYIDSEAILH